MVNGSVDMLVGEQWWEVGRERGERREERGEREGGGKRWREGVRESGGGGEVASYLGYNIFSIFNFNFSATSAKEILYTLRNGICMQADW